jgi:hypothetical protein
MTSLLEISYEYSHSIPLLSVRGHSTTNVGNLSLKSHGADEIDSRCVFHDRFRAASCFVSVQVKKSLSKNSVIKRESERASSRVSNLRGDIRVTENRLFRAAWRSSHVDFSVNCGVGGVLTWSNQSACGRERRFSVVTAMSPKKTGGRKFRSAISRGSQARERPNASWPMRPAPTRAPPNAGCRASAGPAHRPPPFARSWSTSSVASSFRQSHITLRNSASSSMVISGFVVFVWGRCSCWTNQAPRSCGCQGERFEQVFEETSRPIDYPSSAASASFSGLTKSPTWSCRKSADARSARRNSGSRASASRTRAPSSSSAPKCSIDRSAA